MAIDLMPGFGAFTPAASGSIDALVSTAVAAYSTRKLRSAYSGSALRVKRSSDNTEQDIGFSGNDLDTAALAAFVPSGTGWVVTWYDQVGSNNLVAASNSPYIVLSGSLQTKNTKPAVFFEQTTPVYIQNTSGILESASQYTLSVVSLISDVTTNFGRILSFGKVGEANDFTDVGNLLGFYRDNANNAVIHSRPTSSGTVTMSVTEDQLFHAIAYQDASQYNMILDGTAGTPVTFSATALAANLDMGVGKPATDTGNLYGGHIGELIIWSSALASGDRTTVYTNTKTYWGTP